MLNIRTLQDANLIATKVLPAANAANFGATIDLRSISAGRDDGVELDISLPVTPSLADAKNVTLTLKDSPDNVTFTAVADLPAIVTTGGGGVGGPAISRRFKLPIGIHQYVRLDAAVDNAGGDSTAVSATLALFF